MTDAADRIESVVEHAAETAAAIVEGEALDAAAAIEAAEERIESAEEAAEALALAAMQTQIGQRVTELTERLDTWQRNVNDALETLTRAQADMQAMLAELQTKIASPQLAALLIPAQSQQTPEAEATETPLAAETVAAVITPMEAAANQDQNGPTGVVLPAAPVKRSRWI